MNKIVEGLKEIEREIKKYKLDIIVGSEHKDLKIVFIEGLEKAKKIIEKYL